MAQAWVYIVARRREGPLYIGMTDDLRARIFQHKHFEFDGLPDHDEANRLVYFEGFDDLLPAIHRKKQLRRWDDRWKARLIETVNPEWADLYEAIGE